MSKSEFDYDLYVIGAGSGGVRAARMSAGFGARVGVCEERFMGGTCVNVGCVPKKLFVYASEFANSYRDATGFGWGEASPRFDWPTLIRNKDAEISRLNGIYDTMLGKAGADVHRGRGRLIGPHEVEVTPSDGGKPVRYTAARILIATGSRAVKPPVDGAEHGVLSDALFELPELPPRIIIVGGGYIGVEFACIFNGLGVDVTLLHRGDYVLRGFDQDIRSFLEDEMRKSGVDVQTRVKISELHCEDTADHKTGEPHQVRLDDGRTFEAELILFATGRRPNTAGLGLQDVGVALGEGGQVIVDDDLRTNIPSVYAVGDVIDRFQLTPVALEEGMMLARTLFGGQPSRPDYENIPTAVFTQPQVGTVGITEAAAREAYGDDDVVIFRSTFRPMKMTLAGRDARSMMKIIVRKSTDRVLGFHMVGPDAGEITQGLGVAMKCGVTKAQLDSTVGIHPTAAEEFVTMRTPVQS